MKQAKAVRNFLIGESVLILLAAAVLWRGEGRILDAGTLLILQAGIVLGTIFRTIRPLESFEKTLEAVTDGEWKEEEFGQVPAEVPYVEPIREAMERYAAFRTRENSAQIFNKQTELTALQSQINPHFLYNTLECIRGQALMDDNLEIARMVEALGAFFRYSISRKGNLVTLKDELDNIDNYMLIQRYRFGNRFSMEVIIDEEDEEAYNCLIPRLIIQPIVENAIFHGLEERLEGGRVTIEVIVTEKTLIITVSDNGKGISREQLNKLNAKIRSRDTNPEDGEAGNQRNTGIALPNIHKRIQLLFGEEYGVDIYSTPGQGTDVEVTIPVNYGHDWEAEDEERDTEDQRSELPS
ncbi:sensor histidine kinase [Massilistercora timonensis]|uniref:sensor histidine kinase n=1 Tax=Massilistercora timonensis TaxID=2086584 RepID=UPI0032084CBC